MKMGKGVAGVCIGIVSALILFVLYYSLDPGRDVDLAGGFARLKEEAGLRLSHHDRYKFILDAPDLKSDTRVGIPKGTLFRKGGDDAVSFIVSRDTVFELSPGDGGGHEIPVFMLDIDLWDSKKLQGEYTPEVADPGSSLYKLIDLADREDADWIARAFAILAIQNDPGLERLKYLHYDAPVSSSGGRGFTMVVYDTFKAYSFKRVRTAEAMLREIGLDPDKFKMFPENRALLEDCLETYAFTGPNHKLPGRGGVGFNIAGFEGEPAVEELLLKYMTGHNDVEYRDAAYGTLLKSGGLLGTEDELYAKAVGAEDRLVRLLATETLQRKENAIVLPLRLLYENDQLASAEFNKPFVYMREKKPGKSPAPGESLLAYWERTGGWDELKASGIDTSRLKDDVEKVAGLEKKFIQSLLDDLKSGVPGKALPASPILSSRFSRQPEAFDAFKEVIAGDSTPTGLRAAMVGQLKCFHENQIDIQDFLCECAGREYDPETQKNLIANWNLLDEKNIMRFFAAFPQSSPKEIKLSIIKEMPGFKFKAEASEILKSMYYSSKDKDVEMAALMSITGNGLPCKDEILVAAFDNTENEGVLLYALTHVIRSNNHELVSKMVEAIDRKNSIKVKRSLIQTYRGNIWHNFNKDVFNVVMSFAEKQDDFEIQEMLLRMADALGSNRMRKQAEAAVIYQALLAKPELHERILKSTVSKVKDGKFTEFEDDFFKRASEAKDMPTAYLFYYPVLEWNKERAFKILEKWLAADEAHKEAALNQMIREFPENPKTRKYVEKNKDVKSHMLKLDIKKFLENNKP